MTQNNICDKCRREKCTNGTCEALKRQGLEPLTLHDFCHGHEEKPRCPRCNGRGEVLAEKEDISDDGLKPCPSCRSPKQESSSPKENCAFCTMFKDGQEIIDIEPLNPVTAGHRLIIPRQHVSNFSDDPALTGKVMDYAAQYVRWHGIDANLIVSKGSTATQTVFHLHVHVVPRSEGDGLKLPWSK